MYPALEGQLHKCLSRQTGVSPSPRISCLCLIGELIELFSEILDIGGNQLNQGPVMFMTANMRDMFSAYHYLAKKRPLLRFQNKRKGLDLRSTTRFFLFELRGDKRRRFSLAPEFQT
jgi:hypothetical protein